MSSVFGANIAFIEELQEKYRTDPASVGASWREFFDDCEPAADSEPEPAPTPITPPRILILHEDGTIGAYIHLLRGGLRTKPGDRVETGAVIGTSGNSGRSTGPHLHFEVFRKLDAVRRETLPVRFRTSDGDGVTLEPGTSYRADYDRTASRARRKWPPIESTRSGIELIVAETPPMAGWASELFTLRVSTNGGSPTFSPRA